MFESVEIIVWRLVQTKPKMNTKKVISAIFEIFSLMYLYSITCIISQQSLHVIVVFFHLKEETYLTGARSIPVYTLGAASSPVAWWRSSSWAG